MMQSFVYAHIAILGGKNRINHKKKLCSQKKVTKFAEP